MEQTRIQSQATAYLCVDQFIRTSIDARAVKTAFELGCIDQLRGGAIRSPAQLQAAAGIDPAASRMLLHLLRANEVVTGPEQAIALTQSFKDALAFEDLLLAKIQFAELVAPDFFNLFTVLLRDPPRFMREARIFKLFDYRRCLNDSPENREATRRWMAFTTALTRHEAGVILQHYDFSPHRRTLDIGGNSGEFALQICRAFPQIEATVLDLPLVCQVGREHVASRSEGSRIRFVEGDALAGPLPSGHDLISFKSMLHDWPDDHARRLMENATAALAPGGTFLIFERSALDIPQTGMPWAPLPMLLFFRSFRPESFYADYLRQRGYQDVQTHQIHLETPFILVTARKPK